MEELCLMQSSFIGPHEVGVSHILNSKDNMNFVVEELDAHGYRVGRNVFFCDVVAAVDFYAQRVKVGVRPEVPYTNPLPECAHSPAFIAISKKRKGLYEYGEVGLYNEAGGFGVVRTQNSDETIFFHVSNKRRVAWRPVQGDVVEFTVVYDKTRDRETASDIDLYSSSASKRYRLGETRLPQDLRADRVQK